MLDKLLDILGIASAADSIVPENGRERLGCIMGLMIIVPVAAILLLISLI